jgi:hypothetical protein
LDSAAESDRVDIFVSEIEESREQISEDADVPCHTSFPGALNCVYDFEGAERRVADEETLARQVIQRNVEPLSHVHAITDEAMVKEDDVYNGGDVHILSFDHDPNCSLSIASLHSHDLIPESLTRDEEAQNEVVLAPLVVSPCPEVEENVS